MNMMKRVLFFFRGISLSLMFLGLCASCKHDYLVTVSNPWTVARQAEMVEVTNPFGMSPVVVKDERGEEVVNQVTYEGTVIFRVNIGGKELQRYTISKGKAKADTLTRGRVYPERLDDMAWENDKVAFRVYGPALEARGEQAYGYDIFTKRDTDKPVVEEFYRRELNEKGYSYHDDHGHGMDCYAVGPTLGAGVAALVLDDTIFYPKCYRDVRILDNGPLRFTAELTFEPKDLNLEDTTIVETRRISLDAGEHLNRTVVFYKQLKKRTPLVIGLGLHDREGRIVADPAGRYMAYEDPTQGTENGKIYVGVVSLDSLESIQPVYFSPEEKARRNGAEGHLLGRDTYRPQSDYEYYWGYGWSKADMPNMEAWEQYLKDFIHRQKEPLNVSCEE